MTIFKQSVECNKVQILDCLQQLLQLQFLRYFNAELMAVLLGKSGYCIIQFFEKAVSRC